MIIYAQYKTKYGTRQECEVEFEELNFLNNEVAEIVTALIPFIKENDVVEFTCIDVIDDDYEGEE